MSDRKSAARVPLVLIVDDDFTTALTLQGLLQGAGLATLLAGSLAEADALFHAQPIALVLLDVHLPDGYGLDLCRKLTAVSPVPILFISGDGDVATKTGGFAAGGVDYITKPFKGVELRSRVRNHLELYAYRTNLERLVEERTTEAELLKDVIIEAMGEMAEYRDPETGSHIHRTREYVLLLAETLASRGHFTATLTPDYITLLHKSAPLHDIGKVAIRDSILLKPGKLTAEEFEEMKAHTLFGEEAIANLEQMAGHPTSFLSCAKEIAGSHHEKYDGSGYPRGITGEDIPLAGRIMAIADVYDALISKRVYKEAMSHQSAMEIMIRGKGSHFDPLMLEAFLQVEPIFNQIAARNID